MKKEFEIFVPGRLCLFGEHSDWAGKHRNTNSDIIEGHALVTGIEQGIKALIKPSNKFIFNSKKEHFEVKMDQASLQKEAKNGGYYSYICGVAAYVKENYNVGGLEISIKEVTLPIKKGLSSSAAICVLVARAFNEMYNLQLNTIGEMQIAYFGERKTPSRCGRMDQACAFGIKPVSLTFDGDDIDVEEIHVGGNFYWVFADLMSQKNTKKILSSLNACYPFAQNQISANVQKYLGEMNQNINARAIKYFESGDAVNMGKLMIEAQDGFDKFVAPACPEELTSPVLHKVLMDKKIKELTYGAKGVGSQGDGTVQFLAKDEKTQAELVNYLENELKMDSYTLTIKKFNPVKKAIIPLAGMASRMYPIAKVVKKAFLPVIDNNMIKPVIMTLLEELDEVGIDDIYLVINKEDQEYYDKFFKGELEEDLQAKLSTDMLAYENKIQKIGKKITYVYQEEKLGLGHAVYICHNYIKDEPFMLLLGDQIYSSNTNKSCTKQVLDSYLATGEVTLSAYNIPLENVSNYGIMSGKFDDKNNQFEISRFDEKPTVEYAEQFLGTIDNNKDKKYYSVFGIYILKSKIFDILEKMIDDYKKGNGEIQITNAIDTLRIEEDVNAFIPDGETYDVGTPKNYTTTLETYRGRYRR